jgi:hypothetical protein
MIVGSRIIKEDDVFSSLEVRLASFYLLHTQHSEKKEQERGKDGGQYRCFEMIKAWNKRQNR